jgi:methionyl aminopeptidase
MLKEGDIVSIDCGVVLDGYYGDSAITVPVNDHLDEKVKRLLEVTEATLYRAIEQMLPGNSQGDEGAAASRHCAGD